MAKAERTKVERTVLVDDGVTLTLSLHEARALLMLTGRVVGDDDRTARGLTTKIYYALSHAGVKYRRYPYFDGGDFSQSEASDGSLEFVQDDGNWA